MRNDKTKDGLDDLIIGSTNQNIDKLCTMPRATFSDYDSKKTEEYFEKCGCRV